MELRNLTQDLKSGTYEGVPFEMIENFDQISRLCDEIDIFAHEYDYNDDLKFNGYRSMVRIINKFAITSRGTLHQSKQLYHSTLEMTRLLLDLTTKLISLHEERKSRENNNQTRLSSDKMELFLRRLNEFKQSRPVLQDKLKHYWANFSLFWMNKSCRPMAHLYTIMLSMICQVPLSLVGAAFREYQGSLIAKLGWTGNAFFPTNIANYSNNIIFSGISMAKAIRQRVSVQCITIPRQYEWTVPDNGDRVVRNPSPLHPQKAIRKSVSARVIRHNGSEPNGTVILHGQGGAFIIDARQMHESYLFDWISQLDGAVILNVEYSRPVRYPIALQEFLDTYLWLTSESEEVAEILGFKPQKVVFCGDSAGGHLLFALSLVLRDIQFENPSFIKIYPAAFVGFYPALSLIDGNLPSFYMSTLEAFITPSLLFSIISLYAAGIVYESECYELDNNLPVRENDPYSEPSSWQTFYNTWIRREKSWLECEPEKARERFSKICQKALKPYMSPAECYDLNLVRDLPLYLISCEFDPLLDSTIELARKWKGQVHLDVLDDLHHAFLLYSAGDTAKSGALLCLRRLKDSLGLKSY
ncbi:uncharacterized protein LOC141857832 [Brevipalpus obovatus]|uniref:uncharacterized protein LOC141857832 n=1 Tax=Brevipalpus obovatus TaxID=246614 RepID=UPI003D9F5EB2